MARASSVLPVPDSPVMSTGESRRRHAAEQRQHRVHRRVLRDDFRRRVDARQPRLEIAILARELMLLPRAPHQHVDLGHAVRLRHVVVRAELHRGDRRLDGAVAGDDDDLRRIGLGAQMLERLETVHLRHDDVDSATSNASSRIACSAALPVAHAHDVMAAAAQERAQDLREILLVFGDENANAAAAAFTGSVMRRSPEGECGTRCPRPPRCRPRCGRHAR